MADQSPKLLTPAASDEPVTQHMRRDFIRLSADQTIGAALEGLRQHPPRERIIYFYVVDGAGRLEGVVPTRRLLLHPPERLVRDVMVRQVVAVPESTTVLEACEFFIQHRFLAFPVVDCERHVLGVVDIDLYTDELGYLTDARKRDDLFQQIGVRLAGPQQLSALAAFRRRLPWLGCNLAAGILAAFLAGIFEETLTRAVTLTLFFPVVLNLAESVSSQSVSLTLHLLQSEKPTWRAIPGKVRGEAVTGLMLGGACGLAVGAVALAWLGQVRVALALLGGITGGVAVSAVMGLTLPFLLRRLRLDPRIAAGPVALAAADVLTILVYLNLARWLIG